MAAFRETLSTQGCSLTPRIDIDDIRPDQLLRLRDGRIGMRLVSQPLGTGGILSPK